MGKSVTARVGQARIIFRMTRLFLYEHITAHGLGRDPASPEHSLFIEGTAMLRAIRTDFAAIPGVEVLTGTPGEFGALAAVADWSFIIAPETDGVLLKLADDVERVGGRLLGPRPQAIALTSDKFALFQHWRSQGVPTPATALVPEPPPGWPCVVKRRDGAGSDGTKLVGTGGEYADLDGPWIAQPFCRGQPASVAYILAPGDIVALPPTFQCVSTDGRFRYGGGLVPIALELGMRAERLGRRALRGIPGLLGYVGVDLILGDAEDGSGDVALEINPRLTTSYVGLRAHLGGNLAALILEIANGGPGRLRLAPRGRVAFSAAGEIRHEPAGDWWSGEPRDSRNSDFPF